MLDTTTFKAFILFSGQNLQGSLARPHLKQLYGTYESHFSVNNLAGLWPLLRGKFTSNLKTEYTEFTVAGSFSKNMHLSQPFYSTQRKPQHRGKFSFCSHMQTTMQRGVCWWKCKYKCCFHQIYSKVT